MKNITQGVYVCKDVCRKVTLKPHPLKVFVPARASIFAVSVACTLEQVFWALVHGQVCTLQRCVFTPTYTSASTLATGCAHMCICIYVCICMNMHIDAYVRL